MAKYIFITGVSSGIGRALTEKLLQKGFIVFGSVRKVEEAEQLQKEWTTNFHAILLDITNPESVTLARKKVEKQLNGQGLFALVNNAGISVQGPTAFTPLDAIRYQFEVNVFGTIQMIQAFRELLLRGGEPGIAPRIVNVSSVSALFTMPFLGPYAASKKALEGFSDALRFEESIHGLKVISVLPGPIQTKIWEKALGAPDYFVSTPFQSFSIIAQKAIRNSEKSGLSASTLAEKLVRIIQKSRPKPTYIIGRHTWKYAFLPILPKSLIIRIVSQKLKELKQRYS